MKLNTKIITVIFEAAFIPLLLASFVVYSNVKKEHEQDMLAKLDSIAEIQESRLMVVAEQELEALNILTHGFPAHISVQDYLKHPDMQRQEELAEDFARYIVSAPHYREIFIADMQGSVIAATNAARLGTNVSAEDFFKRGIVRNDVAVFGAHGNTLDHYLAGPIVLGVGVTGVFVVVDSADDVLNVVHDYTGLGSTGETVLAKSFADVGDGAQFITPTRFDATAPLFRVVPKTQANMPAVQAILGREGVFSDAVDYRGVPVYAATRYVPSLGWGIVAKIDRTEALAPIAKLEELFWVIILMSGLLITIIGISMARSIARPLGKLEEGTKIVAGGDLTYRLEIKDGEEIVHLVQNFNRMTEKLEESYGMLEARVAERTKALELKTKEAQENQIETQHALEHLKVQDQRLAEAKVRDDAIFASIGDGLIVTDVRGFITFVNPAFERMLGWKSEEVVGAPLVDKIHRTDESGAVIPFIIPQTMLVAGHGVEALTSSMYFVRKDGSRFPVSFIAAPIKLEGEVVGVVEVFSDITEEKAIDVARNEFISLSSHQLRTPLTAISWYVEMLLSGEAGELNERQKRYAEEAYRGSRRMAELVKALLAISKLELGNSAMNPVPTDVAALAAQAVKEQEPSMQEKHLVLTARLQADMPPFVTDPKFLGMIFDNLLSNSVKYTPNDGKLLFAVEMKLAGDEIAGRIVNRPAVLISVQDSGIGIPDDQQDKLFTKFFRADNAKKVDQGGTGLGLYIVKKVVELSGGMVWFESVEGKGTTFYVLLPREE